MFEAFNAQAKSVGDLLGDSQPAKIVVPQFQRGYSWEKRHVDTFWNDIRTHMKERAVRDGPDRYFLGPIVLRQPSKESIFLLDGQQRLATVTILLSVLRDLASQLGITDAQIFAHDIQAHFISKEDVGYSLELGELDKTYFIQAVQSFPSVDVKPTLRSHRNIQRAREVLTASVSQSVSGMSPVDTLAEFKAIRKVVRTELIMASIPVASERDAFKIFETLNDRGLRLSTPDLLLNYLMGSAATDQDRSTIRDLWNEMIEGMGRRDINRFFRHMWVSKYGDLKSVDLFTALKERIENDKLSSLDFTESCSQECSRYLELLKSDKEELGSAAPLVRRLVRDLGFEPALPLLMAAYAELSLSELEKIARWLLVFVTRYSIIAKLDSGGMETILFSLARDLREKSSGGAKAKEQMRLVKDHLVKNAPVDDLVETSMLFAELSQEEAGYVVGRLAVHMQSKTKELELGESNLEHIFPKRPSAEWKDAQSLQQFLWNIGNLTMLGKRLNSNAASKGYPTKRREYAKSSVVMSKSLASEYDKWGIDQIIDRAKKITPLVKEVWNFDNPSRV